MEIELTTLNRLAHPGEGDNSARVPQGWSSTTLASWVPCLPCKHHGNPLSALDFIELLGGADQVTNKKTLRRE